jgi:CAAX prenyl protease-like protein
MIPIDLSRVHERAVICRALPFLLFIGLLMLASMAGAWLPGETSTTLRDGLAIGRGVIVALVLVLLWPAYSELRNPLAAHSIHWVLAVVGGLAVFVVWILLYPGEPANVTSERFVPLLADGTMNWPKALLRLAGLGLVVPVMEELFWRSLILRWIQADDFLALSPADIGARPFLITTVLFAIEHDTWLAGAIAGIVYNLLYMRSGNLWVPILSHAVTNCLLGAWVIYAGAWQLW